MDSTMSGVWQTHARRRIYGARPIHTIPMIRCYTEHCHR